MYFNKEIIFKNKESQSVATIRHLQKYTFLQKTRAECQVYPNDHYKIAYFLDGAPVPT